MVDAALLARSPLDAVLTAGRHGEATALPGVTLQEIVPAAAASIAARLGRGDVVRMSLGLPPPRRWADVSGMRAIWSGPDRWLVLADHDIEAELRDRLGSAASITDQSDARCVVRISGPHARDVLAKGVALDLHARAFRAGDTASTLVAHTTVQLWQLDDAPSYDMAVARGYAAGLAAFLLESAAEFGVEVLSPA